MARERPSVGEEARRHVTVTHGMLVEIDGRRIHPVYATAWMVRHVEEAARTLVEPHFGPDEDATGYAISLVHERPARPGDRLEIVARVTHVDEHRCETDVEVLGPRGRVGSGSLVQRYIRRGRLG